MPSWRPELILSSTASRPQPEESVDVHAPHTERGTRSLPPYAGRQQVGRAARLACAAAQFCEQLCRRRRRSAIHQRLDGASDRGDGAAIPAPTPRLTEGSHHVSVWPVAVLRSASGGTLRARSPTRRLVLVRSPASSP